VAGAHAGREWPANSLAPCLIEKPHADEQIVGVATLAVQGTHTIDRQIGQEAIEVGIVDAAVPANAGRLRLTAPARPLRHPRPAPHGVPAK
jgi:hypothetical protein